MIYNTRKKLANLADPRRRSVYPVELCAILIADDGRETWKNLSHSFPFAARYRRRCTLIFRMYRRIRDEHGVQEEDAYE